MLIEVFKSTVPSFVKSHSNIEGTPEERLVKFTVSGATPEVVLAKKSAIGYNGGGGGGGKITVVLMSSRITGL